jgi:hypothetical protein
MGAAIKNLTRALPKNLEDGGRVDLLSDDEETSPAAAAGTCACKRADLTSLVFYHSIFEYFRLSDGSSWKRAGHLKFQFSLAIHQMRFSVK